MSVVFQYSGKANAGKTDELALTFSQMEKGLRNEGGFERALLLVSRITLQSQLLFQWSSFEDGLAFDRKFQLGLSERFRPLLESQGTLITSMLEKELGKVPMARKAAEGAADGEVVLHFSGTAAPGDIPRAQSVLQSVVLPLLQKCPGYLGLTILVNHQEGKLQFLVTFAEFDKSFAWVRDNARHLLTPFDGVIDNPTPPLFFAVMGHIERSAAASAG